MLLKVVRKQQALNEQTQAAKKKEAEKDEKKRRERIQVDRNKSKTCKLCIEICEVDDHSTDPLIYSFHVPDRY